MEKIIKAFAWGDCDGFEAMIESNLYKQYEDILKLFIDLSWLEVEGVLNSNKYFDAKFELLDLIDPKLLEQISNL